MLYGDVKWYEFYDIKFSRFDTQTANLNEPDWLCSQSHLNGDVFDRTNFLSELSFSPPGPDNKISDRTGKARLKFKRPRRAIIEQGHDI